MLPYVAREKFRNWRCKLDDSVTAYDRLIVGFTSQIVKLFVADVIMRATLHIETVAL
jgi:hypothetical protein